MQDAVPGAPGAPVIGAGQGQAAPQGAQSGRREEQLDLAAVSVASRLPQFWTDQPRHWFIQIEAILNPQHLSDQAKYDLVLGKLSKEAIGQITDLLLDPPITGKYSMLKDKLLSIYEESATRQLQKLLSGLELGEQKPSQLLRKMRDLARGKVPDATLCILWQNHLPNTARAAVAVADTKNLDSLAAIADKVLEATHPVQIAEVQASTSRDFGRVSEIAMVRAEIAKMDIRLSNLEGRSGNQERCQCGRGRSASRGRNGSRGRSVSRGRSASRRTPESPDWLCFYHFKYGEKASRCVPPCAWKGKEGNSK